MKKYMKTKNLILVVALLFSSLIISCSDFLNDPDIQDDPNRATTVSADLLFNSVQVRQFFRYEGHLSRTTSIWMQQLGGVDRQSLALGQYVYTENEWNGEMSGIYTGGALIDIRNIRAEAKAKGWKTYEGIAKVWEALVMGTSASLWGKLPYSEAVSDVVTTPKLDEQKSIYDAAIALLGDANSGAIADLTTGGGYKPPNDHVYAGNNAKWIEAAYTLKARFLLHWAEVNSGNYALALAAIQKGISVNANNFKTKRTTIENEASAIYQFWRQRDSYIRAGKYMIDLLKSRTDPRLDKYFQPGIGSLAGQYVGAAPGQALTDASNLSAAMRANSLSFDIMSFSEANLIWAECAYKTGDATTALAKLNAARRAEEGRWGLAANSLGVATGLTGTALIDAIMQEKYIALFMNIEAYNDWKRTNRQPLVPYTGAQIPRRLLYGDGERIANPNIPTPSAQPARNANDPGNTY